jgi:hypothetical protein
VAAREAAPATAELLGQWLLSYCNSFRHRQRMRRWLFRGHGLGNARVNLVGSLFYMYFYYIYLIGDAKHYLYILLFPHR